MRTVWSQKSYIGVRNEDPVSCVTTDTLFGKFGYRWVDYWWLKSSTSSLHLKGSFGHEYKGCYSPRENLLGCSGSWCREQYYIRRRPILHKKWTKTRMIWPPRNSGPCTGSMDSSVVDRVSDRLEYKSCVNTYYSRGPDHPLFLYICECILYFLHFYSLASLRQVPSFFHPFRSPWEDGHKDSRGMD